MYLYLLLPQVPEESKAEDHQTGHWPGGRLHQVGRSFFFLCWKSNRGVAITAAATAFHIRSVLWGSERVAASCCSRDIRFTRRTSNQSSCLCSACSHVSTNSSLHLETDFCCHHIFSLYDDGTRPSCQSETLRLWLSAGGLRVVIKRT